MARATPETPPAQTRAGRRRLETRARLIAAARRIIAERRGLDAVPIGEITEQADVAIGSFYNHFASKEELLEVVVTSALEQHGEMLDEVTAGVTDAAEACAIGIRLTLGMVRSDPVFGAFVAHTGLYIAQLQSNLLHRLAGDLYLGFESGRFSVPDHSTSVALVGGAVLGAMLAERLNTLPEDADCLATQQLLELLGISKREARKIARLPLPSIPPARQSLATMDPMTSTPTRESDTR